MDRTDSIGHDDGPGKAQFARSPDPDRALRAYFAELGENADEAPRILPACAGRQSLPLILISQLPRSGGSLLSQLCDGHNQLLVHPSEMRIGFPGKDSWPSFDPSERPERLFAMLFQSQLARLASLGYHKRGKAGGKPERLPFDYSPSEHYRAFVELLNAAPASSGPRGSFAMILLSSLSKAVSICPRRTRRAVLDSYFQSLFQAWPAGRACDPRYVVGFVPRTALNAENVAGFFRDYPDGRLVTILRHPADWFVSRRAHTKEGVERYNDIEKELRLWNKMAEAALSYRWRYRHKFLLLSFRALVTDREGTMRRIASWCGIDFDAALLRQTFAGHSIQPNTNFEDSLEQRPEAVLERHTQLDENERQRIDALSERMQARLREADCHC